MSRGGKVKDCTGCEGHQGNYKHSGIPSHTCENIKTTTADTLNRFYSYEGIVSRVTRALVVERGGLSLLI